MAKEVLDQVEALRDDMVQALIEMCKIPAIAPESDGKGEVKRSLYLLKLLDELGFDHVAVVRAKDPRVPEGYRPNIVVSIPGKDADLAPLWVVSHMDIVPEGDRKLWDADPYDPVIRGGKLIGRGVEDNGQALIGSLFAAKALMNMGNKPKRRVKLAFVADEEVGSKYGIRYLVKMGLFKKGDLIVVPDAGDPEGRHIEVVEKSHLHFKVVTKGVQAHASRPHKGLNAFRAASKFVARVTDLLYEKFDERDELFSPPYSTFEATKKEPNVPNFNTIPGEDVFHMDCRILPSQSIDFVLDFIKGIALEIGRETGAYIQLEDIYYNLAPPATPVDSTVVKHLQVAIKKVRGVDAEPIGIGGGTCAAFFREKGLPVAVWATIEEKAHEPNESIIIDNLVNDAKVFALMYLM